MKDWILIDVFNKCLFQPFKVLATETLTRKAIDADIYNAIPTEKVDGTCCYVTTYKGNGEELYKDSSH